VRILIFHGYLLSGTGSNVYNARLAAALVQLGHEVHLLSQERHAERLGFVDAVGDWDSGALRVRTLRDAVRCTVYRPDIGALLPVYVADRYEGMEARTFSECSDEEIERYVAANVEAVHEVGARARAQLALANHLVMGPLICARALAGAVPYAVKIHGSALEYTVKASPERFLPAAREGLGAARGVLVGSWHTALSLCEALGEPGVIARTRLGPPGVDITRFKPLEAHARRAGAQGAAGATAAALIRGLSEGLRERAAAGAPKSSGSAFARDDLEAARALERLDPAHERLVAFVGKLIVSKGVDLLLAAWPLVLERVPDATLVVVGFGSYRPALERLAAALAAGELESVAEIARRGRGLERTATERADAGCDQRPLRYLASFLERLQGERRERYLAAARKLPERATFTGRLDHEELAQLLPACEAVVVPSTFPESFGMIAVEAAACGAFPVSAAHSGLAETSAMLAGALPPAAARLLSFATDEDAVQALADRVSDWLAAGPQLREQTRSALVATVRERYSWEGVARGVIAAARGELERLERPRAAGAFG
jgi:glycosyltransferase involved in cell wall biosynthesis